MYTYIYACKYKYICVYMYVCLYMYISVIIKYTISNFNDDLIFSFSLWVNLKIFLKSHLLQRIPTTDRRNSKATNSSLETSVPSNLTAACHALIIHNYL